MNTSESISHMIGGRQNLVKRLFYNSLLHPHKLKLLHAYCPTVSIYKDM